MAAVVTVIAVAGAGAVSASASDKKAISIKSVVAGKSAIAGSNVAGDMDSMKAVLATLVTNNTITQAQSVSIAAAFSAAMIGKHDGEEGPGMGGMGGPGMGHGDDKAIILSTLGISVADLQAGFKAGKSLATIAGSKTAALITALVAAESAQIDAAVTAGRITAAQATTAKAGLTAQVTAHVNQVPGVGGIGRMHK